MVTAVLLKQKENMLLVDLHTAVLASFPSPPQGVWYLPGVGIPIRAYALCILTGILVATWLTRKRYQAAGGNGEVILDALVVVILCGIIGGRAYHVITDADQYFCTDCNPLDVFAITNGGLGIWGAVALGTLGVWLLLRRKGLDFGTFADAAAPGLILAQAIGRFGNYFNQELYGAPTTVPWGLEIYKRVNDQGVVDQLTGRSTGEVLAVVHPTFLYEAIWNVLVCLVLIWAGKRFHLVGGRVFALYVAGYCAGRFIIELMRTDTATLILGLRVNTWTSGVLFVAAVMVFVYLGAKQKAAAAHEGEAK